ncbi:MAG TPA: DNA polymerase III subunit gamma/tau [Candidatus Doudnabacteria bacterium]|nr:DNA polymerase III subunit gamma/tau [Candidatus Doudnabacteria bacterium]
MAVYYQTYRPQKFSEVVGQESIVKALSQAVKLGRVGHAYLFTGSRGVGKTTLARILAKAVNCPKAKDGDPCGSCDVCEAIGRGTFLDVVEIDAASHTGVDNIRELIERINFGPSQGKTKVFIIDEVHMLSKAAFNALLKTLEEPPAHALFILATTDIDKVPETIISRTQRFDFRKITAPHILKTLESIVKQEKLKLPAGALEIIVENSEGGLRDALSQLSMISVLEKDHSESDIHLLLGTTSRATIEELLGFISQGQTSSLPEFFAKQTELNFDASSFTRKILSVLQELLEQSLAGQSHKSKLGQAFALPQILHIIRLYLRAYKEIEKALSPELPLLLASIEAALYMSGSGGQAPKNISDTNSSSENSKPVVSSAQVVAVAPVTVVEEKLEIEQISEPVSVNENSNVVLTEDKVKSWWPELIAEVRKFNSPLATLLKNAPISKVEGNRVAVSVKYLFHKEQLESAKMRTLINDYLSKQAGGAVAFVAVIDKNVSVSEKITDTAVVVSDALKIFGGELVE